MPHVRLAYALALCAAATAARPADAAVLEEITAQNAAGRTVFLLLTDAAAQGLEGARTVAASAQQQTPNSAVIELNRSDPAQQAAVAKYRVAGAPVPLVLVIARNGLGVGAANPLAEGATARLVALVPTPRKADYLKALNDRQVACVVFARNAMQERGSLIQQLNRAAQTPRLNMNTVYVDLDDPAERSFVAEWKVNAQQLNRPLLAFVNPRGQIIGRLQGSPNANQIVQMARKKVTRCNCGNPNCKGHR